MNFLQNLPNYVYLPSISIPQGIFAVQQLQNAICTADCQSIEACCQQTPQLLQNPLPNGDLPLHYAAKTAHNSEVIAILLKQGADPLQLDRDGLNAAECAKLAGNQKAFEAILHHCISQDLQVLENAEVTAQARKIADQLRGLKYKDASPLLKAVMEKNEEQVATLLSANPINAQEIAKNGDTLLHAAVISGSQKILELCLNDPKAVERVNVQNDQRLTALHYAAAAGRFDMMQLLVKHGGDIRIKDHSDVTPVALLGISIERKNPLEITKSELFTFGLSTLFWGTRFLLSGGYIPATQAQDVIHKLSVLSLGISTLPQLGSWKNMPWKNLAWLGLALFEYNFPASQLTMPLQAFRTAMLAKSAFEGLITCWRDASFGRGKALLKAAVVHGPKMATAYDTLGSIGQKLGLTTLPRHVDLINTLKKNESQCTYLYSRNLCKSRAEEVYDICRRSPFEDCLKAQKAFESILANLDKNMLQCESPSMRPNWSVCCKKARMVYGFCLNSSSQDCQEMQEDFDNTLDKMAEIQQFTEENCKNLNASHCDYLKTSIERNCKFESVLSDACGNIQQKYTDFIKTLEKHKDACNRLSEEDKKSCIWAAEHVFTDCHFDVCFSDNRCPKSKIDFENRLSKQFEIDELLRYDCTSLSDLSLRCEKLKSKVQIFCEYNGSNFILDGCIENQKKFRDFIKNPRPDPSEANGESWKFVKDFFRKYSFWGTPSDPSGNSSEKPGGSHSEENRKTSENSDNFHSNENDDNSENFNHNYSSREINSGETCAQAIKTLCGKPNCSIKQLKTQFRQQILENHPDKFPDPQQKEIAGQKTIELNSLYEIAQTEECLKYVKIK